MLAVNDGKFYRRIVCGGSCTLRTYDHVLQWFCDHWPIGLPWPADIPRPEPAPGSPYARLLADQSSSGTMDTPPTSSYAEALRATRAASDALDAAFALDRNDMGRDDRIKQCESALLAAGSVLDADGQIACPEAFLISLPNNPRRHVYDAVIRRYADGCPGQGKEPRMNTKGRRIFEALVMSGDVRFASRAPLRRAIQAQLDAVAAIPMPQLMAAGTQQ